MNRIILISGKQGSGKTTQSRLLLEMAHKNGYTPWVFKFADPIYELHESALPILKKYGLRPQDMKKDGEYLQIIGTEYGRNLLGQDVWVRTCRNRVDFFLEKMQEHGLAIIDDCRFENEYDAFPDALKVNLSASEAERRSRCSYWRENTNHPSETGLDNYIVHGKFSVAGAMRMDTTHARPEVTAQAIWEKFIEGILK